MCLILFGYKVSRQYPVILIANRDEFYGRPTAPLHAWETPPVFAGKDLEQGGTWFGVNHNGTFAALTNYRDPALLKQNAPSRGKIIVDFLAARASCQAHFNLKKTFKQYNGFNLLFGSKKELFWFSNLKQTMEKVPPGIHGLSNRFLNTAWPKVTAGRKAFKKALQNPVTTESLFSVLADESVPQDDQLPDTGVGLEWERLLSPLFIQSDTYGTRSSTVMLMDQDNTITLVERTYAPREKVNFTDKHICFTVKDP